LLWQSPRWPSGVDWELGRLYHYHGKSPVLVTPYHAALEDGKR